MVKVNLVSSAGADTIGRHVEDVQFVPLVGFGWRCDFCGEMVGQERAPAPERCPRCSGSHFTSMCTWRERYRMGGLRLDSVALPSGGEPPEVPPNPADPLPDPPRPVPDLPPGFPNPTPVR